MTMAVRTFPPAPSRAFRAATRSTCATSITMRSPRSISFLLVAFKSTMRLPYVFPSRTMAPVVSVLSASLVAVPAFIRVDPVTTSGPVRMTMVTSQRSSSSSGGSEQVRKTVRAPRACARAKAPRTKGVVPLAAMPTTTSLLPTSSASICPLP